MTAGTTVLTNLPTVPNMTDFIGNPANFQPDTDIFNVDELWRQRKVDATGLYFETSTEVGDSEPDSVFWGSLQKEATKWTKNLKS